MWTNWRQGAQGSAVFLEFIICPSGISKSPFPLSLRVHRSSSRRQSKKEFSTISSSIGIIMVIVLVLSHVEFGQYK
ncbi:hypothetical protein NC652_025353 [Populus alba x Populus x berolinensis]|nr:hypothetical protein NC652_025353 [Populus alba x Populus x berolinensis]